LLNVLAACAVSLACGAPVDALRAGVEGFGGVPHRQELVREWRGVRWYNDSIATAPERSMASVRSYHQPVVLMLGGRDKDLPWGDLAALIRERVDHVVIFGEAAEKIAAAIGPVRSGERTYSVEMCAGL
jgi:UDP-N-acetylmuramoylalanine--D-glutamate ligase